MKGIMEAVLCATVVLTGGLTRTAVAEDLVHEQTEPVLVTQDLSSPWASDRFAIEPGRYYRIELTSRSADGAMVASRYHDAGGNALVVDSYNLVRPSREAMTTRWYFQPPPGAVTGEVAVAVGAGKTFDAQRILVSAVEAEEVRAWMEAELKALPPMTFVPPANRWEALPETLARLQSGRPLRVVMLGDSIINDTFNGMLELMLRKRWPAADLTLIPSVRGGTGVSYYQQEGRVKEYVLDHAPDLVVVGGVSHGYDLPAMRSVLQQIRAASGTEILVLSGAMAPEDNLRKGLLVRLGLSGLEAAARVRAFSHGLPAAAQEVGAGFFDMRRAWDAYVDESGMATPCYMRDETHGDMTGKLLLAALLSRYLGGGEAVSE